MSYHAPATLDEALRLAAQGGGKVIAGGTDVYPAMAQGQTPDRFLDITRIGGLRGINRTEAGWRIGAATTWTDVIRASLPPGFDALKQAAREVGSVQIQNAATLCGNLCNASPAADGVPPLLILDAEVELASAENGTRTVPLRDFISGVRKTARREDELVTAVSIPTPPQDMGSAFEKLGSRRYLVISITMTAASVSCDAAGKITQARVAVGACSAVAQRLPALEAALIGQDARRAEVDPAHLSALSPISDVRGTAAFRQEVVATQCARAIARAAGHE
ncbi:xanthine dehydrogenase family protein subunit M [uncultured Sulfitobacter sp.]|uniref:FAD binding domain-containing protein n=1 Tax=uncultured Sulfitobacter sp. TaxID=191468 RepID=UPI0026097A6C|nr:xanthine dehydrogenase family protein subunit M [uncultured Sulfitobacter sp.]